MMLHTGVSLSSPDLIDLVLAAADDGKDLFLAPVERPTADRLIRFCTELRKRALVLLPGAIYPPPDFRVWTAGAPAIPFPAGSFDPVFADVRILGSPDSEGILRNTELDVLILPFAECAFVSEHGYRAAYKWIGELRAAGVGCRVIALFSVAQKNNIRLRELTGETNTIVFQQDADVRFPAVIWNDRKERDRYIKSVCEKQALKKTVVLFSDRIQAEAFCSGFSLDHADFVHGGRDAQANAGAIAAFAEGKRRVLAATKHLLPTAPFLHADRVIYAGLPFSVAHAVRCETLLEAGELLIAYAPEDKSAAIALSEGFADAAGVNRAQLLFYREKKLQALLDRLDISD